MTTASAIPVPTPPDFVPPRRSLALGEEELGSWLENAEPGARIEYHRGHLVIDRARGFSPFGDKLRRKLDTLANRALALADEGRLLLVQQRHDASDYSYFAVMVKRPAQTRHPA